MTESERQEVEWITVSARKAQEQYGAGYKSPKIREMLAYWRKNRPRMVAKYLRLGVLNQLAASREAAYFNVRSQNLNAGLSPSDAEREASSELLMEPESEDFPNQQEQPSSEAITT